MFAHLWNELAGEASEHGWRWEYIWSYDPLS
jgi:hypothetical protein